MKIVKALNELSEPISIKMVQQSSEEIHLFGVAVTIPPKTICFSSVVPKVTKNIDTIKCDDVVKVEWIPKKNFNCLVCYEH